MALDSNGRYRMLSVADYFARQPTKDCAEIAEQICDGFYLELKRLRLWLYRNCHFTYNESFFKGGYMAQQGQQAELTAINIGNYRNLINHALVMTCQQKLSYEPQAVDGSTESLEQVRLAKGLLNLYSNRSDIDMDGVLRRATENCLLFGESYIAALWDPSKGKTATTNLDETDLQPEGDVSFKVYDPMSVIRDIQRSDGQSDEWMILREEANKVDLAVQFPQYEETIMSSVPSSYLFDRQIFPTVTPLDNIIWTYTLFHKRTLSVPNGRMLKYLRGGIALSDGPLPDEYEAIPVYRMCASDLIGSPWGYSKFFDAVPLCHAVSRLATALVSNEMNFAVQSIVAPHDAGYNCAQLGANMQLITYDGSKAVNKPEGLNLTKSSPSTSQLMNVLTQTVGTLMGVNEVTRGNPDLILKGAQSGAALALMSTQSIEFNSDIAKTYQVTAERLGTALIKMLTVKSVTPREGKTKGMSGKFYGKQFEGKDLNRIDRVSVKTGNPLSQTPSGRLQIAESLLAGNFLKNRQDYMSVIETGNLEPMMEGADAEIALIKDENDKLGQGTLPDGTQPVPDAAPFDDHVTHIAEHKVLLASVEARQNIPLANAVLKHIQSHLDFLAGNQQHGPINPIIATITNQPTLPPGTPDQIVLPKQQPPLPPMGGQQPSMPPRNAMKAGVPPQQLSTPTNAPGAPGAVNVAQAPVIAK